MPVDSNYKSRPLPAFHPSRFSLNQYTNMRNLKRHYPRVNGDDDRSLYCPDCECIHPTVPMENVPNQTLRACSFCGRDIWDVRDDEELGFFQEFPHLTAHVLRDIADQD